jgi:hypothetical protein
VDIFYLLEPKTTDQINFGMILKKERESSTMLDGTPNCLQSRRLPVTVPKMSKFVGHRQAATITRSLSEPPQTAVAQIETPLQIRPRKTLGTFQKMLS